MLKKTVTYSDFLGTERTEELYFNLTKMELTDLQMSVDGGLQNRLKKMLDAVNKREIYSEFVNIVLAAYGEISPDGKYHIKVDENGHKLSDKFKQSLAYEALMDDICQNETTIAEFINGILPKKIRDEIKQGDAANGPHPVK